MDTKAVKTIRRLCSLGLPPHEVIPSILRLLHDFVPSFSNTYFTVNKGGYLDGIYDERPETYEIMPVYYDLVKDKLEKEVFDGWVSTTRFRSTVNMDLIWKVDRETFFKHPVYQEMMRKIGYNFGLHRPIWWGDKNYGVIELQRTFTDNPFSTSEMVKFDHLCRQIDYMFGASAHRASSEEYLSMRSAIIVVDSAGHIQSMSEHGERLLYLAQVDNFNAAIDKTGEFRHGDVITGLKNRLVALFNGSCSQTPSITVINKWGRFRISAFFMNLIEPGKSNPLINIQIEHLSPRDLALVEKLEDHSLTQRQKDICIEICRGVPYSEIASELGIALSTVVSHKKELFDRLSVSHRHELLARILYG